MAAPLSRRIARRLRRAALGSRGRTPARGAKPAQSKRPGASSGAATTAAAAARPAPVKPAVALPPGAHVYAGIIKQSLQLSGLRLGPAEPQVSLVLPPLEPDKIFAGVATALEFGRRLALATGRPLRVVPLDDALPEPLTAAVRTFLARDGQPVPPVAVVPQPLLPHTTVSAQDLWVVTYWTTAHAADVARRLGVLDPKQVVYLVQDYEPGFHPWSVPHALTRATYHAGFHHVINSRPLADYLAVQEGAQADHGLVLAPNLELDRLAAAAAARHQEPVVRTFFYARPSKPRNLYQLGVAALRSAAETLRRDGIAWQVVSAGEEHPELPLGDGSFVRGLGILPWSAYFDLLSRIDVGLTLMFSPHPSHPPLEIAVSGGLAVTNRLDRARDGFHDRIITAAADPDALAGALVTAIRRSRDEGPGGFSPPVPGRLGDDLDTVIAGLLQRLG